MKKLQVLNIILGISVIVIALIIARFTFLTYDDFEFEAAVRDQGIISFMKDRYFSFDGRSISPVNYLRLVAIKHLSTPVHNILILLLFFIALYIFYKNVLQKNSQSSSASTLDFWITFLIFAISTFLGYKKLYGDTFYWQTGTILLYYYFFGVIWLSLYLNLNKINLGIIILSLILGFGTQDLTVPLITILLIDMFSKTFNTKLSRKELIILLLSFLIGFIIVLIAPGNKGRILHHTIDTPQKLILTLLTSLLESPAKMFSFIGPLFIFLFIYTFLSSLLGIKYETTLSIENKQSWKAVLEDFKWLIVAFSSITPFFLTPYNLTPRHAIFAGLLITPFLIKVYNIISQFIINFSKTNKLKTYFLITNFFIFSFLYINSLLPKTYREFLNFKKNEYDIMKAKKKGKHTVYLRLPSKEKNKIISITPVTEDQNNINNKFYRTYYKIDTVLPSEN